MSDGNESDLLTQVEVSNDSEEDTRRIVNCGGSKIAVENSHGQPDATARAATPNATIATEATTGNGPTRESAVETLESLSPHHDYPDSSDGSISDDSDESDVVPALSLTEKRNRNIQRHRDVLDRLGIEYGMLKARSNSRRKRTAPFGEHRPGRPLPRGMLLFSGGTARHRDAMRTLPSSIIATDNTQRCLSLSQLYETYPGRLNVIRKLRDILSVPLVDNPLPPHTTTDTSPPPIFITGPAGCGKTSIVQDVLQHVVESAVPCGCSGNEPTNDTALAARAYVDCRTLDIPSLEELVRDVYSQFAPQFKSTLNRSRVPPREPFPTMAPNGHSDTSHSHAPESQLTALPPDIPKECDYESSTMSTAANVTEEPLRRTSMQRGAKRAPPPPRLKGSGTTRFTGATQQDSGTVDETDQRGTTAPMMAVWRLGTALERWLYRRSGPKAAFLVIDNAEQLLSLAGSSRYKSTGATDHVNFLIQLLLLPRTLRLNLTIIVITKSILLEHSALNATSARGTLIGNVLPLRILFPAYQGKPTIETILGTAMVKRLMVGEGWGETDFYQAVVKSFVSTLVSFLYDLTRDVKEYIRIGRALWPTYVQPVLPENIDATLRKFTQTTTGNAGRMSRSETQREILSLLDQRIFPSARHALDHGVAALAFESPPSEPWTMPNNNGSPPSDIPYLAKFLLLAVYVCQVNRPDKDKALFSIQTNGKRKRREQTETGEDVAFGATTVRPRTFPLERLYSLYVSMVSLNPKKDESGENHDEMLLSLGNVAFHETVAYLRDIGILHDYPKRMATDPIRISQRSFWSSLTRDEAMSIAKSVDFPLERYIL